MEASAAELEELSKKSFKKNTQYATINAVGIYKKFCEQLGIQSDLKKMTKSTLAEIPKKLYAGPESKTANFTNQQLAMQCVRAFQDTFWQKLGGT